MFPLQGSISKGWLAREAGVKFNQPYYLEPSVRHKTDAQCRAYVRDALGDLDLLVTESNLGQRDYLEDTQVLVGGIQPNMILGMLVGATFLPQDDLDADISPTPLAGVPVAEYPDPESLLKHELIRMLDEQMALVTAAGSLHPIPPFFWDRSGRATIHGVLTTAQKLVGEAFFLTMLTDAAAAQHILDWITKAFQVLVRHFAAIGDINISAVHVGECSGCMIDPQAFERFILPGAEYFASTLGPLRFHSCGASTHLLASMRRMQGLDSLDLGGDTSIAKVRELFGSDFPIDIAPIPGDLAADSPTPLIDWASQVIEENAGGPMTILYHLEPDYRVENLRALQDYLQAV